MRMAFLQPPLGSLFSLDFRGLPMKVSKCIQLQLNNLVNCTDERKINTQRLGIFLCLREVFFGEVSNLKYLNAFTWEIQNGTSNLPGLVSNRSVFSLLRLSTELTKFFPQIAYVSNLCLQKEWCKFLFETVVKKSCCFKIWRIVPRDCGMYYILYKCWYLFLFCTYILYLLYLRHFLRL